MDKKWFELIDRGNDVTVQVPSDFNIAGIRTITLVKMCIDKFEAILEIIKGYKNKDMDVYIRGLGASSCPLCKRFNNTYRSKCDGCPIMEKTGELCCYSTPYWNVAKIQPAHEMIENLEAEIKFLKGILK